MATDKAVGLDATAVVLEIVGNLRTRPFLLLTALAVVLFFFGLVSGAELMKEHRWEIALAMLVPLLLDVLLQYQEARKKTKAQAIAGVSGAELAIPAPRKFSLKAIAGLVINIAILQTYGLTAEQWRDIALQTGMLLCAIFALGLAVSGLSDARNDRVRGKGMASASIILSIVLILSSLGVIMNTHYLAVIEGRLEFGPTRVVEPVAPPPPPAPVSPPPRTASIPLEAQMNLQQGMNYARSGDMEKRPQRVFARHPKIPSVRRRVF